MTCSHTRRLRHHRRAGLGSWARRRRVGAGWRGEVGGGSTSWHGIEVVGDVERVRVVGSEADATSAVALRCRGGLQCRWGSRYATAPGQVARGEEDVTVVLELGVARRTDIDGSSVQGTPVLVDVEDDEADGGGVFHEEQQGGGWR